MKELCSNWVTASFLWMLITRRTGVREFGNHKQNTSNSIAPKRRKGNLKYKLLMSVNQSFNQCLYAPLTRTTLICSAEVHFLRMVSMKRDLVCKHILMAGVVLPALTFLLGGTALAQRTSDSPPGMDERSGPFSGSHGPTTFGGKHDSPNKPVDSTFPGEIHGVTRYPNGLPMPEAPQSPPPWPLTVSSVAWLQTYEP